MQSVPLTEPGVNLSASTHDKYSVHFLCGVDWPDSAGCYPLTAVTMRVAVVGELVVSVLAWGLVGGQGLRAGCVDSASHEHLLEVTLSVLQRAEKSRPQGILPQSGLSRPDASQLLCAKAIGSAHCYLNPSFPSESLLQPTSFSLSLSLSLPPSLPPSLPVSCPPPSAELRP